MMMEFMPATDTADTFRALKVPVIQFQVSDS
jgi:hypothetical protein